MSRGVNRRRGAVAQGGCGCGCVQSGTSAPAGPDDARRSGRRAGEATRSERRGQRLETVPVKAGAPGSGAARQRRKRGDCASQELAAADRRVRKGLVMEARVQRPEGVEDSD